MTVGECIAFVDEIKPNSFSKRAKVMWLNEIEGMIQTDIMLIRENIRQYIADDSVSCLASFGSDRVTLTSPIRAQIGGEITISGTQRNNKTMTVLNVSADGKTLVFAPDTLSPGALSATFVYEGGTRELLIPAPFSEVYYDYLAMKIAENHEESAEQNNRAATFDRRYRELMRWYADTYAPAGGRRAKRNDLDDPDERIRREVSL